MRKMKIKKITLAALLTTTASFVVPIVPGLHAADTFTTAIEYARAAKIKQYIDRQNTLKQYFEQYILETGDLNPYNSEVQTRFGLNPNLFTNLSGQAWQSGTTGIHLAYDQNTYKLYINNNLSSGTLPSLSLSTYLNAPNRSGTDTVSDTGDLTVTSPASPKLREFTYFVKSLRAKGNIVDLNAPADTSKVWYKPNGQGSFEVFKHDGTSWVSLGEVGNLTKDRELILDDPSVLDTLPGIAGMRVVVKSGGMLQYYRYANDTDRWLPESTNANIDIGDELPVDITGTAFVSGDGTGTICTRSQPCSPSVLIQKKDIVQNIHCVGTPSGAFGTVPGLVEVHVDDATAGCSMSTSLLKSQKPGLNFIIENKGTLDLAISGDSYPNGSATVTNAASGTLNLAITADNSGYGGYYGGKYGLQSVVVISSGDIKNMDITAKNIEGYVADNSDLYGKIGLVAPQIQMEVKGDVREMQIQSLTANIVNNGTIGHLKIGGGTWYYNGNFQQYTPANGRLMSHNSISNKGMINYMEMVGSTRSAYDSLIFTNDGTIEVIAGAEFRNDIQTLTFANNGVWQRGENLRNRLYTKRIGYQYYGMIYAYAGTTSNPAKLLVNLTNNGTISFNDSSVPTYSPVIQGENTNTKFTLNITNNGAIRNDVPRVNITKNATLNITGTGSSDW